MYLGHDDDNALAGPAAQDDAGPAEIRGRLAERGAAATVGALADRNRHLDAEHVAQEPGDGVAVKCAHFAPVPPKRSVRTRQQRRGGNARRPGYAVEPKHDAVDVAPTPILAGLE